MQHLDDRIRPPASLRLQAASSAPFSVACRPLAAGGSTVASCFTLVPSQVRILQSYQKPQNPASRGALRFFGRDDRIRTCGLCVPNATLYQAEPHPVTQNILTHFTAFVYPLLLPVHNFSASCKKTASTASDVLPNSCQIKWFATFSRGNPC